MILVCFGHPKPPCLQVGESPVLWMVTALANAVVEDDLSTTESPASHAGLWGLAKAFRNEHPELPPAITLDLEETVCRRTGSPSWMCCGRITYSINEFSAMGQSLQPSSRSPFLEKGIPGSRKTDGPSSRHGGHVWPWQVTRTFGTATEDAAAAGKPVRARAGSATLRRQRVKATDGSDLKISTTSLVAKWIVSFNSGPKLGSISQLFFEEVRYGVYFSPRHIDF